MQLSETVLRDLAALRCDPFVVSFYLDVDGRRYPRPSDLEPRIGHLFRVARARADALGRDARVAVEDDLAAIGTSLSGLERHAARGIALFSCVRQGQLLAVPLGVPVADEVHLDALPHLAPLLRALQGTRPCLVVLVDRDGARFVRLAGGEVAEHGGPANGVRRRVDTDVELGSFARQHEETRRRHLRAVADAVEQELRADPGGGVLLGGPEAQGLAAELDGVVPVAAELAVAMSASAHDVAQRAAAACADLERRREAGLVAELSERLGKGATLGLEQTLDAVEGGRVGTLVIEEGVAIAGGRCGACGALSAGEGVCRRCGGRLEPVEDLAAVTIADALVKGGSVEVVDVAGFAEQGGIGALERY